MCLMNTVLKKFVNESLFDASKALLHHLHIVFNEVTRVPVPFEGLYPLDFSKALRVVLAKVEHTYFIGTVDESSLTGSAETLSAEEVRDLQSCSLALHTGDGAHDGAGFEVLGRYGRNGCGHILAPYRSITDYHYLVQVGALLFEHHLHVCLGFHLLSGVADVRYSQRGSFGDSEGELSVNISYSTIACTNFKDRGPYDRLIVRIGHHTIHCKILS